MNFNHTTFKSELDSYSGIDVSSSDWEQWSGTSGELNTRIDFSKDSCDYRTWYPETTIMQGNAGILVSNKTDFKRGTGDDHIITLTGYSLGPNGPEIVFAKASVQFNGSSQNNVASAPIKLGGSELGNAGNDFGQAIYDSLNASIDDADFGNIDDSTTCRQSLPDIARAIVNSMIKSVA